MAVRMKHKDDPTARISTALSGPDKDGGHMFHDKDVEQAKMLGWEVFHRPEDQVLAPEPKKPEEDGADGAEDAAQDAEAAAAADGEEAGETAEDGARDDADAPQRKPKRGKL